MVECEECWNEVKCAKTGEFEVVCWCAIFLSRVIILFNSSIIISLLLRTSCFQIYTPVWMTNVIRIRLNS